MGGHESRCHLAKTSWTKFPTKFLPFGSKIFQVWGKILQDTFPKEKWQREFYFQLIGKAKSCNVLERSLDRFYYRTFPGQLSSRRSKSICNEDNSCSPYYQGILHKVVIKLDPNGRDCEHFAHPDMLEKCIGKPWPYLFPPFNIFPIFRWIKSHERWRGQQ